MDRALRNCVLAFFAAVYFFAIGIAGSTASYKQLYELPGKEVQKYSVAPSTLIFWHTSEISVGPQNQVPTAPFKNLLEAFGAPESSNAHLHLNYFPCFVNDTNSLLIKLKLITLLFPFHTFW